MKTIILSIVLMVSVWDFACDHCNIYLNLSPNDYRNSISLLMRQRNMYGEYDMFGEMTATKHAGHGNDMAFWGKQVYETYQTYELRGSFYFRERWNTLFILPFVNNTQRIEDFDRYTITGFGDPIVLQSFQVYSTKRDTAEHNFFQRLTIGGGIKLPLGKTNLQYANGTPNLDLQPGTGSWDLIAYTAYSLKWSFFGVIANTNLKLNGKDQLNYRYGKTLNTTLNLFADIPLKNTTFRFSTGGNLEYATFDATYYAYDQPAYMHEDTGGKILFANAGLKWFFKRFTVFGEYQKMVYSELNGFTQLLTRQKINCGITYSF